MRTIQISYSEINQTAIVNFMYTPILSFFLRPYMPFIKMVPVVFMLFYVLLSIPQYIMTSFHVSDILP